MRIFICTLLLAYFAVSVAPATNSREMERDRLLFSDQFIVEEPDASLTRSLFLDDCCFDFQTIHSGGLNLGDPRELELSVHPGEKRGD
jgi:hypothetical protein